MSVATYQLVFIKAFDDDDDDDDDADADADDVLPLSFLPKDEKSGILVTPFRLNVLFYQQQ